MTKKEAMKLMKRFFITFICCVPLFLFVGVLWGQYFSQPALVTIFTVFAGTVFAIEEYVHYKNINKQKEIKNSKKK